MMHLPIPRKDMRAVYPTQCFLA